MESLGAPLWTADGAHKPSGGFTAAEYAPLGNMGDFPTFRRRGMKGGFGGTAGRWWGQLASGFSHPAEGSGLLSARAGV